MKPNPGKLQALVRLIAIVSLIIMMLAFAGPVGAAPDCAELRCGQAVVDGDYAEWDVPGSFTDWSGSEDFVAYMYRAFESSKPKESALFMRYDLATQTAYVLVLAKPGVPGIKSATDAWISISSTSGTISNKVVTGSSEDDGVPPDFAWVDVGYDGNSNHVRGFEASFSLAPTTSKYLGAHLQVWDDGESQTSGIASKTIHIKTGCLLASIGDCVWHDDDRDGNGPVGCTKGPEFDNNEVVMPNVDVQLIRKTGSNTIATVVAQQTTDANGKYLFTDLNAGDYIVDVLELSVLNYFGGPFVKTTAEPYPYSLAQGENHRHADFGFDNNPGPVYVGDWVWYDINKDGLQNDGTLLYESASGDMYDTGIACVEVSLWVGPDKDNLTFIGRTYTDGWGNYAFLLLKPNAVGQRYFTGVGQGAAEDPDVASFIVYYNGGSPDHTCGRELAEWVDPNYLFSSVAASAPMRPLMSPDETTTPPLLSTSLPNPGQFDLGLDFGFSATPTAVSLQAFDATALPLASVEMAVAAAGALIAGALAWRRRR